MSGITTPEIVKLINKPNPIILEIGCNDGSNTREFLRSFPDPTVICFEPDPRARARFAHEMSRFTHTGACVMFPLAIGAANGMVDFYPSYADGKIQPMAEWDYSGSIRKPKEHLDEYKWCHFRDPIQVPMIRLDDSIRQYFGRLPPIDFIWADTQGAEVDVIEGGRETLARTHYFYTEYNNREMYEGQINLEQITAWLSDFELVTRYPEDVLLRNRLWTDTSNQSVRSSESVEPMERTTTGA